MNQILVITPGESRIIGPKGLVTLGGKNSTGIKFNDLKKADDYAVISIANESITIMPLMGSRREQKHLQELERFELNDLLIISLPAQTRDLVGKSNSLDLDLLSEACSKIRIQSSSSAIYNIVLEYLLKICDFDRGLIIAKNEKESFEVVSHLGTDPSAPWLSESFLTEILSKREPIVIPNLIGSRFEKNESLMGTGFLSVAAWPLVWNDRVVGTLLGGSGMPHNGPDQEIKKKIQILAAFASQSVSAFVRTKQLENQLASEKTLSDKGPFTTNSKEMFEVMSLAGRIAPSDLNIYIQGETGTGKEVLSKWIHKKAFQDRAPFVPVNCGALPENLIESILFGHKKGSFTGATSDQTGKFVLAHGGTLFLDEVADLPLHVQGKLLRAIQEKQIEPIGASKSISVNTRVICATHKDLYEMVCSGKFREDLYYRLAEVNLAIPPLRERPEDISLIAHEYMISEKVDKKLSPETLEWLEDQKWEGNVRELLSSLKRVTLLANNSTLEISDFKKSARRNQKEAHWLGAENLDSAIRKFQTEKILLALNKSSGNRNDAAKLLGLNPRTFFRHLETIREVSPHKLSELQ